MALRVARGLFRLWLVLSVLWIGGVGIGTWRTLTKDEFILPSTREEEVRRASFIALAPPIFTLGFGSALIWAFRGARASP